MKIAVPPAPPPVWAAPQVATDVPANVPVRAQEHQHQAVVRDAAIRAVEPRQAEEAVRDAAARAAEVHRAEVAVQVVLQLVLPHAG